MSFTAVAAAGLATSLATMGELFTLRGVEHTGIIDSVSTSVQFGMGMAIPSEPIVITFAVVDLSPALSLGERITARGKAYVIRTIDEDEISYTVHCEKVEAH